MGLAADYGLLVLQVAPGSGAEQAGLRGGHEPAYLGNQQIMLGGDLIIAIDDRDIESQQDMAQVMNKHRAGDTVKVTVYRGKRKLVLPVTLLCAVVDFFTVAFFAAFLVGAEEEGTGDGVVLGGTGRGVAAVDVIGVALVALFFVGDLAVFFDAGCGAVVVSVFVAA